MRIIAVIVFLLSAEILFAQETDTAVQELQNVTVRAYEQIRNYKDVPAAVNHIGRTTLLVGTPFSIVQAVNTVAGLRMEERSPGSYRFNIRGSSLRSPFGVRNVKIYFNDIPFTDPGGQSYLNQLGYYNFNSVDVIKGPSGSIYGAGTGGVMLIESMNNDADSKMNAALEYTTGNYNTHNVFGRINAGNSQRSQFSFQHQQSAGYRDHSALRRDVFCYSGNYQLKKSELKTSFLYGDLEYETPGALTSAEYNISPKASRPSAGSFPSAVQAKAAIMQKMFLAGASLNAYLGRGFANKTVLYGMFSELRNPAIQNYGHNSEPHTGLRSVFTYKPRVKKDEISLQFGTEIQQGFASVWIHKNVNGNADSLRSTDKINNRQSMLFAQGNFESEDWIFTAGASVNFLRVEFERFAPAASGRQIQKFSNNIAPRIAVLKKLNKISAYASVSKGFSPPTTAELFPTGNAANPELNAERGTNYEIGLKGSPMRKLFIDINAFYFNLKNTIVLRRTAGGGDYYINAGSTKQRGIETSLQYAIFSKAKTLQKSMLWLSHTYHNFHYKEFKQVDADYSGNRLPSVPKHTFSAGLDVISKKGFSGTLSYYYAGRIPLNDANTAFANEYHLLGLKIGYHSSFKQKTNYRINIGADNLLNQQYSLGNDINGFNGRYFNAAPGRNFYAGISFNLTSSN